MRPFFISFTLTLVVLGTMIGCKDIKEEEPDSSSSATQGKKAHPGHRSGETKSRPRKGNSNQSSPRPISAVKPKLRKPKPRPGKLINISSPSKTNTHNSRNFLKKAARLRGRYSPTNSAQNAKTTAMMQEINTEISKISSTLPELQAARKEQAQARKAIHNTRRQLADKIPQAKVILEELR